MRVRLSTLFVLVAVCAAIAAFIGSRRVYHPIATIEILGPDLASFDFEEQFYQSVEKNIANLLIYGSIANKDPRSAYEISISDQGAMRSIIQLNVSAQRFQDTEQDSKLFFQAALGALESIEEANPELEVRLLNLSKAPGS